jgi:ubiquinone/menaquinone biosynthesis C-methylase UbiE
MAFSLTLPLRRLILSPEELADRLHLAPTSRVLELGPGPGYFSAEVARRVPEGELVLADLQWGMLRRARQRLADGPKNVRLLQADGLCLPFNADAFDVVFLVAVLGEIPDPTACLSEIARVLKPGGLLSNTEQPGDPDGLSPSTLRSLGEGAGFRFVQQFGRRRNYTANFRKLRVEPSPPYKASRPAATARRSVLAPPSTMLPDARRGAVWLRVHRARTR